MGSRPTAADLALDADPIPNHTKKEPGHDINPLLDGMARLDLLAFMDLSCTAAYYEGMDPTFYRDKSTYLKVLQQHPEIGECETLQIQ